MDDQATKNPPARRENCRKTHSANDEERVAEDRRFRWMIYSATSLQIVLHVTAGWLRNLQLAQDNPYENFYTPWAAVYLFASGMLACNIVLFCISRIASRRALPILMWPWLAVVAHAAWPAFAALCFLLGPFLPLIGAALAVIWFYLPEMKTHPARSSLGRGHGLKARERLGQE